MNYNDELKRVLESQFIDFKVVQQIIEDGASPDTTTSAGNNYLHLAIENQLGQGAILRAIALGVDVNTRGRRSYCQFWCMAKISSGGLPV